MESLDNVSINIINLNVSGWGELFFVAFLKHYKSKEFMNGILMAL
jgi:hypothetical protein